MFGIFKKIIFNTFWIQISSFGILKQAKEIRKHSPPKKENIQKSRKRTNKYQDCYSPYIFQIEQNQKIIKVYFRIYTF